MSSLANTTEKMRSILKIGGIAAGALFAIYLVVMIGIFIKNILFPPPPIEPVQGFGTLPEITFEGPAPVTISYQLNTVTGRLPENLPDRMLVYKLSQPLPDLLSLENARSIAAASDFNSSEIKISDSVYQWTNLNTNAHILIDINTKDFEITSNIIASQNILLNSSLPELDRIERYVTDFLRGMQVDLTGLEFRPETNKYYTFSGSNFVEVDNILNAKAIRVNLFNKSVENDLGTFSFVYPQIDAPLVSLLVSFPSSSRMIVLEGKSYNKIVTEESSDYPIKSIANAYEELQRGLGYLYNPENLPSVQITDAYLAYYLDEDSYEFAQPVYVFEGVNARGYVSAVRVSTQSAELTSE